MADTTTGFEPFRHTLECGHWWDPADTWKPVPRFTVEPLLVGGWGVGVTSVCPRCSERHPSPYPTEAAAWLAVEAMRDLA